MCSETVQPATDAVHSEACRTIIERYGNTMSNPKTFEMAGNSAAPSAKFFDDFAAAFDTLYDRKRGPFMRWVDERFRSDMFIRFRWTFEVFDGLQNKTVADIGCGSGP